MSSLSELCLIIWTIRFIYGTIGIEFTQIKARIINCKQFTPLLYFMYIEQRDKFIMNVSIPVLEDRK